MQSAVSGFGNFRLLEQYETFQKWSMFESFSQSFFGVGGVQFAVLGFGNFRLIEQCETFQKLSMIEIV